MKKLNIGTVFSGIGAPEQALIKMGYKLNILFACDNGEIEIKTPIEELRTKTQGMSPEKTNEYIKQIYKDTKKTNYVKQSYFANYKIKEEVKCPL